jgi:hypothetical protein
MLTLNATECETFEHSKTNVLRIRRPLVFSNVSRLRHNSAVSEIHPRSDVVPKTKVFTLFASSRVREGQQIFLVLWSHHTKSGQVITNVRTRTLTQKRTPDIRLCSTGDSERSNTKVNPRANTRCSFTQPPNQRNFVYPLVVIARAPDKRGQRKEDNEEFKAHNAP